MVFIKEKKKHKHLPANKSWREGERRRGAKKSEQKYFCNFWTTSSDHLFSPSSPSVYYLREKWEEQQNWLRGEVIYFYILYKICTVNQWVILWMACLTAISREACWCGGEKRCGAGEVCCSRAHLISNTNLSYKRGPVCIHLPNNSHSPFSI